MSAGEAALWLLVVCFGLGVLARHISIEARARTMRIPRLPEARAKELSE
jgi:hypothetical protein